MPHGPEGARRARGVKTADRPGATLAVTLGGLLLLLPPACRQRPPSGGEQFRLPPAAEADAAGYRFRPAERQAVDLFLHRNRHLRVAQDSDRREGEDDEPELGNLYGIYHPYFVRGDLNDDGVLDFLLAFVRRDSDRETPWFTVVVFSGRERPGTGTDFEAGAPLERDITLADGDLAIDRDAIVITPDLADETARRYRWDPVRRSYVFVREGEEQPEPPPLVQT